MANISDDIIIEITPIINGVTITIRKKGIEKVSMAEFGVIMAKAYDKMISMNQ